MTQSNWNQRLESLFLAAVDLPSTEQREFLERECGGDRRLRDEVASLLTRATAGIGAGETFQSPVDWKAGVLEEAPGSQLGPYVLRELLGEGGYGVVYLAEQSEPVQRQVAIKILKLGMDTRDVVARFEAERQALAVMQHPNVARIFDAGATGRGRPYFVMEYAPGVPVTEYCDSRQMKAIDRLPLFLDICAAVQHAHQKSILHRDLKPANVLVTEVDGKPQVKVIDFGIAKAIHPTESFHATMTKEGELVGTPYYMSPEQASGSRNLDTRTDLYSLGVLLHELLTGFLPFDFDARNLGDFSEIRRVLLEETPSRPSVRVARADEKARAATVARDSDPATLGRVLHGDLDWILMKALEKEPDRRYASASELAADIERFRRQEPVLARRPSGIYRFRKFVRRNRVSVAALSLVFVSLLIAIIVSRVGLVRARNAEEESREYALAMEQEAKKATTISTFLVSVLTDANPSQNPLSRETTLREALARASREIEGTFDEDAEVEASIRLVIGDAFRSVGSFEEADRHLERTLLLNEKLYGKAGLEYLASLRSMAVLKRLVGDYDGARSRAEEALLVLERHHGQRKSERAQALNQLALILHSMGEQSGAETRFKDAIALQRGFPEERIHLSSTLNNWGRFLQDRGEYERAEEAFRESLAIRMSERGPVHEEVEIVLNNLGYLLQSTDRREEALDLYGKGMKVALKLHGEKHPTVATYLHNIGSVHTELGDPAEGLTFLRRALEMRRELLPAIHSDLSQSLNLVAHSLRLRGDLDEAEPLLHESLRVVRASLGDEHRDTAVALNNLGLLLKQKKDFDGAQKALKESLAVLRGLYPEEHPGIGSVVSNLLDAQRRGRDRAGEAETLFRHGDRLFETTSVGDWKPIDFTLRAAVHFARLEHVERAETARLRAHEAMLAAPKKFRSELRKNAARLANLYEILGDQEKAKRWAESPPLGED